MSAKKYDFSIEQGSSFTMSLIYKNHNGQPIDLTGWTAQLVWRTDNGVVQTFNSGNIDYSVYKFTIESDTGKLKLLIPPSTTRLFNFNTANYDLELKSNSDMYEGSQSKNIIRVLFGIISILKKSY